jgi:hypothetical protein
VKTILFSFALAACLESGFASDLFSSNESTAESTQVLVQNAVSRDSAIASTAIGKLRAIGPEGLDALLKAHVAEVALHLASLQHDQGPGCDQDWEATKMAIDGVSGQCDAYASGLYWYTDLGLARAAARAAGKPILSLRLLGNLNEDYSCANSRFFRTTLYSNAEVSNYLREHFILHWQSVRPVPKLTIDFGEGHKLVRTITGNSVHFVLNQNGEPVDALPGLYGPKAFLRVLTEAQQVAVASAASPREERKGLVRAYHIQSRAALDRQWQADLAKLGDRDIALAAVAVSAAPVAAVPSSALASPPTARAAGKLAISKSAIESPVLRLLQPKGGRGPGPTRGELDDAIWTKLAVLHADDARLDATSKTVIAAKSQTAFGAAELTKAKRLVEDPLLTTWRNLERSISEDSLRNELLLHARIHDWFVQDIAPADLDRLSAKVYAELFLMPENDPWLGLAPANTFCGLPDEGLVNSAKP